MLDIFYVFMHTAFIYELAHAKEAFAQRFPAAVVLHRGNA